MIVVTGGAGFIGSNLVAALNAEGEEDILVSDRLRSNDKWRNLAKHQFSAMVAPEDLIARLNANKGRVRAIFHLGAISSTTVTDGDLVLEQNIQCSQDLWDWARDNGVPLIYASSAATYGDGELGFDDDVSRERIKELRPLNLYGWSKKFFDLSALREASLGNQPPRWYGLKFFNVYGPNEYHKGSMQSVVPQIMSRITAGERSRLFKSHRPDYADGQQLRDFIWVADVCRVMIWLFRSLPESGLYNLGTGKARSFADLAASVYKALGRPPEIDYVDMPDHLRAKYQYFTEARMSKLARAGYDQGFTSLEDGVGEYVTRFLSQEDKYL